MEESAFRAGSNLSLWTVGKRDKHHPIVEETFLFSLLGAGLIPALVNRLIVGPATRHFPLDDLPGNFRQVPTASIAKGHRFDSSIGEFT